MRSELKGIRTVDLAKGSPEAKREEIRRYFHASFDIEEKLYETLASDDVFYLRADPLRHPIVFYLGHTAAFYINKLNIGRILSERIDPRFESMFAIGVDEMSWDDLNEAHYDWPAIPEVRAYRDLVRARIDRLISELPLELPITWDSPWWSVMMGIEHSRIHLETSSVLIRQLPIDKVRQLALWDICLESGPAPGNVLLPAEGGCVTLGKDNDDTYYGWDNEYGKVSYDIKPFLASKYLCSNGEFLEFVRAGGYQNREYWTEEGWAWKQYRNASAPLFWIASGEEYRLRLMASVIDMPWNWPVEVNYLEAKAFCNWKAKQTGRSIRLPLEEEWQWLRDSLIDTDQPLWDKAPGNIDLEYEASPCPVDRHAFGEFYDLIGNVWQWTETPIYGFPGFKVHPYYDDFSTPTFDGKHNLIKGGSWISTGNEALRSSRYAFRRHFYQHAGFRYVESAEPVVTHDVFYETDSEVCLAADRDWGTGRLLENEYAGRLILELAPYLEPEKGGNVLHLGCGTGRTSFELARFYEKVTGVDFTARLVRIATEMKENCFFRYARKDEGEIISFVEANLEENDLKELCDKLEFWQADVSNLIAKFTGYDLIVADNVLSRTTNPQRFLNQIHERLNPGGLLLLADAWDWQESSCRRENWLGGFRKDGEPYPGFEGAKEILSKHFELLAAPRDIPRHQPLSTRQYLLEMVQVSFWRLV